MARRTKDEVDHEAIEIYKMKIAGKKNKEIAESLGIHPSTVSTKISKMRRALADVDERLKKGELMLPVKEQTTALALPTKNPFDQLQTFNQMAGITTAGGAVFGAGVASIVQGFQDEKMPYEQRLMNVMKGGSVVMGGILSLYLTVKQLTEEANKKQNIEAIQVVSSPIETKVGDPRVNTVPTGDKED
jgi:hypothetical protein